MLDVETTSKRPKDKEVFLLETSVLFFGWW